MTTPPGFTKHTVKTDIRTPTGTATISEIFVLPSRYENINYLSHGTFGWVVTAEDHSVPVTSPDYNVAIKKFIKIFDDTTQSHRDRRLKCAVREVMLLDYFRGVPGIVQLKEIIIPGATDPSSFNDVYAVMERYDMSLEGYIKSTNVDSTRRLYITRKILEALHVMHEASIVHRDLKPGNVLLRGDLAADVPSFEVVICDLGGSRGIPEEPNSAFTNKVTTYNFMGPECSVTSLQTKIAEHSAAGDVFSAGCIHGVMAVDSYKRSGVLAREYFVQPGNSDTEHLRRVCEVIGFPSTNDEIFQKIGGRALGGTFDGLRGRLGTAEPYLTAVTDLLLKSSNPEEAELLQRTLKFFPSERPSPAEALTQFFPQTTTVPTLRLTPFKPPSCDTSNTKNITVGEAREIFWQLSQRKVIPNTMPAFPSRYTEITEVSPSDCCVVRVFDALDAEGGPQRVVLRLYQREIEAGYSDVHREFLMMQQPNIVPALSLHVAPGGQSLEAYIVCKRMKTTVGDILKVTPEPLSEDVIQGYVRSVANGLQLIHGHGYIHNNITPFNIMIDDDGNVFLGGVYHNGAVSQPVSSVVVRSPLFMSPRAVVGEPYQFSDDFWALGITMLYMAYGRNPWGCISPASVSQGEHPPIPSGLSDTAQGFILLLLTHDKDPAKRKASPVTLEMIMSHPFLTKK